MISLFGANIGLSQLIRKPLLHNKAITRQIHHCPSRTARLGDKDGRNVLTKIIMEKFL